MRYLEKVILLVLGIFLFVPFIFAYNRDAAVAYAGNWALKRNTDDYASYNSDCANFVSQCLIAGGMDLTMGGDCTDFYNSITTVNGLQNYLVNIEKAVATVGTYASDAPANLQPGDVVTYLSPDNVNHHAMIVTSGSGQNVKLSAHSGDHNNDVDINMEANYYTNNYGGVVTTFFHFPTKAEIGHAQEFYGTGNFFGLDTLIDIILEQGTNFEGYIVDNLYDPGQDLVIGQDTSSLSGCAHYISAYCCDSAKHVPADGQVFGQPWTSDSTNHWAYWARQVVIYANNNGCSNGDILQAIWYISDRTGTFNSILQSIGYPQNGPCKNVNASNINNNGYQGELARNSIKLINNKFNPMKSESMSILVNVSSAGNISIKIYTITGVLVKTVVENYYCPAGTTILGWNGLNDQNAVVASGIYLVQIEALSFKDIKKACVLK